MASTLCRCIMYPEPHAHHVGSQGVPTGPMPLGDNFCSACQGARGGTLLCPLHAAAEEMLEFLELVTTWNGQGYPPVSDWEHEARAILRAVKGES